MSWLRSLTNRQLLRGIVGLALLSTLLCVGVLFGQRARAAEVRTLEHSLDEAIDAAARQRSLLERDLDALHAAVIELQVAAAADDAR